MARAPRITISPTPDEDDLALSEDRENEAKTLADTIDGLRALAGSDTKAIIYKIPHANGKFEQCFVMFPPIDTDALMTDLRARFGPGQYAARIMKNGKVFTTLHFAIAQELNNTPPIQQDVFGGSGGNGILALIMNQSNNQMQMMQAQMQAQAAAQANSTQMMVSMFTSIIPALTGNKDTPAAMISALAPFINKDDGGMKGAIETLAAAKGLFGGSNEAPAENLLDAAVKFAPAAMGALTAALEARGNTRALAAPAPFSAPQHSSAPISIPGSAPITDPILQAIGPDIVFYAAREYLPADAASMVAQRLEDKGIGLDDVQSLVARIAATPSWLETLASEGVDVRAYPEWAQAFLVALHAELSDDPGDVDDSARSGGGGQDAPSDGEVGTGG